jgi:DNA repair photolyase
MRAIRANSRIAFERVTELTQCMEDPSDDWHLGFLAGIFDAEGSRSEHVLRISNMNRDIIDRIVAAMSRFRFDAIVETIEREPRPIFNVRLRGGLPEHLRFFHTVGPAITRKWDIEEQAIKSERDLRVVSIDPLGLRQLYDITTGTGDFIANGVVSHNCYARPTHEYLDLGAGTDFDTKIVVKRNAPELLREAFDKKSWKGELVMFSGVTDCYQAIERDLKITRGCLEVCLEYKNPVSVISKSALVERDIDLFVELAKQARFHIHVSLAFSDDEMSRMIEPWAASPSRRFKVIERLAKAGVPVGVMVAPVIPGVNDSQMVTVLERAAEAGATTAGWVLLRLPHSVKDVFEERIRVAMPLAADKVLHRIRETRGGEKLYDSSFHTRGRGQGPYADTIAMMFDTTIKRLGMNRRDEEAERADELPTTFQRPAPKTGQLSLF